MSPHLETRSGTALLLIAHGSRNAEANLDLHWLAERVQSDDSFEAVVPAYLELAEPGILEGGRRCVEAGARRVILLPYFLSAGVHVQRDLQQARETLALTYPQVEFRLAPPLGRHPGLVAILRERARQAEA